MEVRIGEYIIKGDSLCLWIEKVTKRKKGKNVGSECSVPVTGYYGNVTQLLTGFANRHLRGEGVTEVKEFLRLASETREEIIKLAAGLGKELDEKRRKK